MEKQIVGMWLVEAPEKIRFPPEYFKELKEIEKFYNDRIERIRRVKLRLEKGIDNLYRKKEQEIRLLQKKYLLKMGVKVIA